MKSIITLGRQLGSNGKLIGKALAEKFDIPFYDKEILARISKEKGLKQQIFDNLEEKSTQSLLYSLVMGLQSSKGLYYQYNDMLNGENIFRLQSDMITSIAEKGPCVIVGCCADYILRDNPHLIRLFLCASDEQRIKNLMARDGITEKEAASAINKADKRRSSYYNFYTNNIWGHVSNYDLCLNTGNFSKEDCVKIISDYISARESI